jgi:hypothetical protein
VPPERLSMSFEEETYCVNCRKPTTRHRPWCDKVQTAPAPQQNDIITHPELGPTELISVYRREQAIEDGVLIDCTEDPLDELNRNAGLVFDVALTAAVFDRYVEVPEPFQGSQDIKGRYWDIIRMFRYAAQRVRIFDRELLFEFLCLPNSPSDDDNERPAAGGAYRLVKLKAVVSAGDRGEPCLTFMLPNED